LLDLDFNSRVHFDLRFARVYVEVAALELIPRYIWLDITRSNGWISYARIRYEIDETSHGSSQQQSQALAPLLASTSILPTGVPSLLVSGPLPAPVLLTGIIPSLHSCPPPSSNPSTWPPFQLVQQPTAPPQATGTHPVAGNLTHPLPTHASSTPIVPFSPYQPSLNPLPSVSRPAQPPPVSQPAPPPPVTQSSIITPPAPPPSSLASGPSQYLGPKSLGFKKHQKNKVWYKNKSNQQSAQHNLLLAEKKALKAQIDLLKAIGQVVPKPTKDSSFSQTLGHDSTGTPPPLMGHMADLVVPPSPCRLQLNPLNQMSYLLLLSYINGSFHNLLLDRWR
jgi:hypothetical protein